MAPVEIPRELLEQCFAHGVNTYPEEGCGVLSGPLHQPPLLDGFHLVENIINRMHQEDPERYPRTAGRGYFMDPAEMMRLEKQFANQGRMLKAIFHSHVDVGAYFSQEDMDRALWAGQPILPGVAYLVCGIKNRQPDGAMLAWFDERSGGFKTGPVDGAPGG
ncbi:MAG: Mov34/MPN/PAD-1 family protein [SAR324 cluster bacterium]|nr:Mov34/MPN/PAD-1 family protein [SAR324 cluster bacterium]